VLHRALKLRTKSVAPAKFIGGQTRYRVKREIVPGHRLRSAKTSKAIASFQAIAARTSSGSPLSGGQHICVPTLQERRAQRFGLDRSGERAPKSPRRLGGVM
jgi:hypothetical protein